MEDCLPNLVVAENYVVQPLESIPISMVDYENVGITHLVHASHPMQTGPVIRLTSASSSLKTKNLHPLEAEIQRDYELKQKQFSRQQSSVIHTVPECSLEGIVRRSDQIFQLQPKPVDVSESAPGNADRTNQLQQIYTNDKFTALKPGSQRTDHVLLPQLLHSGKQMILQGKQYIIVPENSPLLTSELKNQKNLASEKPKGSDISTQCDAENGTDLPLIIQTYKNSVTSDNSGTDITEKVKAESDSEEESDDMQPVYDYEPDPESKQPDDYQEEDKGKPNKCYMCFKRFRQKKNMYAHIRKIHSTQPKIEGGILCPLCKMHALRQVHLRNHFETLHDVKIEKEEKLFNTMEEFLTWKEFIETETSSLYVSRSSAKLLSNNQQKTYYKCHRSGNHFTLKTGDRKKRLKLQGSNKIGATCPAAMEVIENVHGVNVTFWKTHVGHDNNLAHLFLNKEDKARITECLTSGVPWDKILEKIKVDSENTSHMPSRLNLVSKQDLRNLKRIHDMKTCPELFPARKKVSQGRKPMKERMLRRASQSLVIEKADLLLNLLETTEVLPEFRPKICLMIDNLIATIKRREVKNIHKRERNRKKRKKKPCELQTKMKSLYSDQIPIRENEKKPVTKEITEGESKKNTTDDGSIETVAAVSVITEKRGRIAMQ